MAETHPQALLDRFEEGAALFNSGQYFACHEAWEDVWRELHGDERRFVQGLIQIAVGLYHASRWNVAGARGLFARAVKRLEGFAPDFGGIQVSALLAEVAPWRAAVELRDEFPPGPVLRYEPGSVEQMLSTAAHEALTHDDQAATGSGDGPSSMPTPDFSRDG